jgi:glucose-1-phosphate cytidylyltransferase|tara:strand:- start:25 stop:726 length:702 start_codon:yes stop_codon:yes gene_type:complete
MRVIILAGGFGTRLGEVTDLIPKPMVAVGGKPIIVHLMEHFASYGHTQFHLALGYKANVIEKYFNEHSFQWSINLHDTGLHTATGGRAKKISPSLNGEQCFLTYGDGLSNVDLSELETFHNNHGRLATVTAVHPAARFGELDLDGDRVLSFEEKPQLQTGWINGGFFLLENDFFKYISSDSIMLEREPLESATKDKNLFAFKHDGFWQCMDTRRDHSLLEELFKKGNPPWQKK